MASADGSSPAPEQPAQQQQQPAREADGDRAASHASSAEEVAAAELHVRLDASRRQLETLTLLMNRELAQLSAMERRAAVVVDDWAVLECCRVALEAATNGALIDDDARKRLTSDDRNAIAACVEEFQARAESGDWEALPHTKLLCALPPELFYVRAPDGPPPAEQPDTVARRLDTSATNATEVSSVRILGEEPDPTAAAEGADEMEAEEALEPEMKVAQVAEFKAAAEASQEQLNVLHELRTHELGVVDRLQRMLADVDPDFDFSVGRRKWRRGGSQARAKSASKVADADSEYAGLNGSSDPSVVKADLRRMHSAEDAHLPAVQRALRTIGRARQIQQRLREAELTARPDGDAADAPLYLTGERWMNAARIAESLRSQCVARAAAASHTPVPSSAAMPAVLADDTQRQHGVSKAVEAAGDVQRARALLDATEELQFALRMAAGMRARRPTHRFRGGGSEDSRRGSVAPSIAVSAAEAVFGGSVSARSRPADDGASQSGATTPAATAGRTASEAGDGDDASSVSSGQLMEELEAERDALTERLQQVEAELDAARNEADVARAEAHTAQDEAHTAAEQRDDMAAKLADVEGFLADSRAAIAEIQAEQRALREEHSRELAEEREAHAATRRALAEAEARLKNLGGLEAQLHKWRGTERELEAALEGARTGQQTAQRELDDTKLNLSAAEIRGARDALAAQELRKRLDEVVGVEFAEFKRQASAALQRAAAANLVLHEGAERAKMEHADEVGRLTQAAQAQEARLIAEVESLQALLEEAQGRYEAAEARLAALRKARLDKRYGSPTSSFSRSKQRGGDADLGGTPQTSGAWSGTGSPHSSFASAAHFAQSTPVFGPSSPPTNRRVHPSYFSKQRSQQSPRAAPGVPPIPVPDVVVSAATDASPRAGSITARFDEAMIPQVPEADASAEVLHESAADTGASPDPRPAAASTARGFFWDDEPEPEPEPQSAVPSMVLGHAETVALLRQWKQQELYKPRV